MTDLPRDNAPVIVSISPALVGSVLSLVEQIEVNSRSNGGVGALLALLAFGTLILFRRPDETDAPAVPLAFSILRAISERRALLPCYLPPQMGGQARKKGAVVVGVVGVVAAPLQIVRASTLALIYLPFGLLFFS